MILCIPDLLWFTDVSFVVQLSLNAVSFFIVLHFNIFVTYFLGFLFQNHVWGMKFCYLGCEIPFLTNVQKEEVTQGWPHPGRVAQFGLYRNSVPGFSPAPIIYEL